MGLPTTPSLSGEMSIANEQGSWPTKPHSGQIGVQAQAIDVLGGSALLFGLYWHLLRRFWSGRGPYRHRLVGKRDAWAASRAETID
jgi:hypothetical protein